MKKTIAKVIIFILTMIIFIESTYATNNGEIKFHIAFETKDLFSNVEARNINLSLTDSNGLVGTVKLDKNNTKIGDYNIIIEINKTGVYIDNYEITITDLPSDEYVIELNGQNHKTYKTEVEISDYSKYIALTTSNNTFTYGDLNSDNKVTTTDLDLLVSDITSLTYKKDLNGDGEVNILDLVIMYKNINEKGSELVFNTEQLSKNENVDITSSLNSTDTVVVGDFSELFDPSSTDRVTFENNDVETDLVIPIIFETPQEMSEIQIDTVTGSGGILGGSALIEYEENGISYSRVVYFGEEESNILLLSTDDSNTITISLGNRVVVKSITVTVTKVVLEDETVSYAIVENVKFIVDLVPENPFASDGIIENLKADAGDSKISLTWNIVPNVSGYRISYGEKSGNYTYSAITSNNYATLTGLENLKDYYIVINALSGDWAGTTSSEVEAKPLPSSPPTTPTSISLTEDDQTLKLNWLEVKNAVGYNLYIRESETDDKFVEYTTLNTSISINALTNDVEYEVYLAAYNAVGESSRSKVVGTPFKVEVDKPLIPTLDQIPSSNITSIVMSDSSNVKYSVQPSGTFDVSFVADDDYSTFWSADVWYKSSAFTFTFDKAYDMSYLVYVTKMEQNYALSLEDYNIRVWQEGEDLNGSGTLIESNTPIERYTDELGNIYHVFPFEKTENVKKITVQAMQWDGSYTNVSLSEIIFYEHNGIDDDITNLFSNNTFTELSSKTTLEQIEEIEERLNDSEGYVIDRNVLQEEVKLAKSLLNNQSLVGYLKDDFVSIDNSKDDGSLWGYSSFEILGLAKYDIILYADIPDGDTLTIYPSQYYATSSAILGNGIELKNGRNIISVQDLTDVYGATEGGVFYYKYTGDNANDISVHFYKQKGVFQGIDTFSDVVIIPSLELYNYSDLTENVDEIKIEIKDYITDLTAHINFTDTNYIFNPSNNSSLNPVNSTEISLNGVLLTLPATEVYSGLSGSTIDDKVDNLYNALLAWEELIYITHYTYGDDIDSREGRQNIRYMRMSDHVFMYAAGSHVGVQYGSTKALVQGSPTSVTGESGNSLYGWGIAHEIGHNLDRMGILEVTNNIYSQLVTTYDSKWGLNSGRVSYDSVYQKTSVGGAGVPNNVFTQLGMYWQLHIAYAGEEQLEFYRDINLEFKKGSYSNYAYTDRFALIASSVAGKDLTEFFTSWGYVLSSDAKKIMSNYEEETRKIQYLSDYSREYRLYGSSGITEVKDITVKAEVTEDTSVTITIDHSYNLDDLQGFEISRNGETIAFITTDTYTEDLGSINNIALEYSALAIDKLGNIVGEEILSNQIKIEYDLTIDSSKYTITEVEGGFKYTFDETHVTSGIIIDNAPSVGEFKVEISVDGEEYFTAKNGDFTLSDSDTKFLNYYNKVGASSTDTRIASYDALEIIVTGLENSSDVSFISYVGDVVNFTDFTIGIMGHDYDTEPGTEYSDDSDIIKKGTVILVGEYRGDPYFNEITINGRFVENSSLDEEEEIVERLFSGTTYMFAEVYEGNISTTISDGLFIFVPDIQSEEELAGHESCGHTSVFPAQFQAIMNRVDSSGNKYVTSNTMWYTSATYETLPTIILE